LKVILVILLVSGLKAEYVINISEMECKKFSDFKNKLKAENSKITEVSSVRHDSFFNGMYVAEVGGYEVYFADTLKKCNSFKKLYKKLMGSK
ncbi:MAG: hypothetical protein U9N59_15925, partial [Campylobacterota bacterium]|nr:hypothetical protein [Campylobacterota bacterium]